MFKKGKNRFGSYGFCRWVWQHTRQYLAQKYPALETATPQFKEFFWRFAVYLWQSERAKQLDNKPIIIAQGLVARLAGAYTSNGILKQGFSAVALLEAFRSQILPGLKWSEADWQQNLAREITETGFDMGDKQMMNFFNYSQRLVDVVTGLPLHRQKITSVETNDYDSILKAISAEYADTQRQKEQKEIQMLLIKYHSQQGRQIEQRKNKHQQRIRQVYQALQAEYFGLKAGGDKGVDVFLEDQSYLERLMIFTNPVYTPCEQSARVTPMDWPNLVAIPRQLREAFFAGDFSADLACIQLAILAELLNQKALKKLLADHKAQNKKIWSWLIGQLPPKTVADADPVNLKKAIKTAVYTLCFGGTARTMFVEGFEAELSLSGKAVKALFKAFLNIKVVKDLLTARDKKLAAIAQDIKNIGGSWEDALEQARSRLALTAQAYEQRAMAAIYREAEIEKQKPQPQWQILLNVYDGVIFSVKRAAMVASVCNQIAGAVDKALLDLNINPAAVFSAAGTVADDDYMTPLKIESFVEIEQIK